MLRFCSTALVRWGLLLCYQSVYFGLLRDSVAGKDRTGVLAILLLDLVGTPKDAIALDYLLSRIGIEREREFLRESLRQWLGDDAMSHPGVAELGSVSPRVADHWQQHLAEKYGGSRGYCKDVLGFNDDEIDVICKNIKRQ
jgi:protein tyrosine/serine phosphatase